MMKGIYGFNIAVKDLDEAVKKYEKIFDTTSWKMEESDFAFPGLAGARLNVNGLIVTLISYTDENTSVAKFLQKNGEGVFLVVLEADNLEEDQERLEAAGLQFVLPEAATGDFGAVNFVHPKTSHGVQYELFQAKTS